MSGETNLAERQSNITDTDDATRLAAGVSENLRWSISHALKVHSLLTSELEKCGESGTSPPTTGSSHRMAIVLRFMDCADPPTTLPAQVILDVRQDLLTQIQRLAKQRRESSFAAAVNHASWRVGLPVWSPFTWPPPPPPIDTRSRHVTTDLAYALNLLDSLDGLTRLSNALEQGWRATRVFLLQSKVEEGNTTAAICRSALRSLDAYKKPLSLSAVTELPELSILNRGTRKST